MTTTQRITLPKVKTRKYHNTTIELDGHRFDSKKEFKRYGELKVMEKAGIIKDLSLQVRYELLPAQQGGIRKELPLEYVADFVYYDNEKSRLIIEDAKGVKTKLYVVKRKLMKQLGWEITEV